jgi:hypothetical protein
MISVGVEANRSSPGAFTPQEQTRFRCDAVSQSARIRALNQAKTTTAGLVTARHVCGVLQAFGGIVRIGNDTLGGGATHKLAPDGRGSNEASSSRSSCTNGSGRATSSNRSARRHGPPGLTSASGNRSARRGSSRGRCASGLFGASRQGSARCDGLAGARDLNGSARAGTTRTHIDPTPGAAIKCDRTVGTSDTQNQKRDHSTHSPKLTPTGGRHNE